MKKSIIFFCFLSLVCLQSAHAQDIVAKLGGTGADDEFQVTDSVGDDKLVVQGDGRVGIGTNTPSATLDVVGTFQLADGTQGAGDILSSDASGNAGWNVGTESLHYFICAGGTYPSNGGSWDVPVTGQVILFAGYQTSSNFIECDGSLLLISEFAQLYAVIQTTYGGDGTTTFAVPDLRNAIPKGSP